LAEIEYRRAGAYSSFNFTVEQEVGGSDQDRALAEIEIDHRVDRAGERADIAQEVADRAVAVAGLGLRAIDRRGGALALPR
jgi:hypothetical protein